jgi:hypothetical protein
MQKHIRDFKRGYELDLPARSAGPRRQLLRQLERS